MIGKFILSFWILRCFCQYGDPVTAIKWPSALQESFDERNDVEIFRSVVKSMREWEMHRKMSRRLKRDVSTVCYEDIGCFEATGPFSYLEMLPSPPKDVGTRFLVYGSRKARSIPMEVPAEDISDKLPHAVDPALPTKVIVHGFGSSCDHIWVYEMRSALMSVHECNIVCVDWGPGSAVPNYVRAAANTRLVGRQLAKLIRSLNVPLEKVHLIGFSLGAHVAGFAGAELGNVSRITGLDPAGPLFESQDIRARLDATDAHFVDVIHSNGEQLILGGLGSWQPMGDVDFYPNGGRMQTGCSNLFLGAVSDIIWSSAVEGRSLCNHRRAYKLFTDSVSPRCRFPAFPCDHGYDGLLRGDCFPCGINGAEKPCGDMGYYSDESPARGQLYLVTREEEPFCAHQYQIKLYNSRRERPARSYGKLQLTLIGEGSLNETFTMTRKDDEELLVGAILQKIVVPHPAVANLEAIEVKYTAYSGWISSGLVSWNIDKVRIIDSFGKSLSVCKRGLVLESSRPVYLPLYPGECNIPPEPETTTSPSTTVYLEPNAQEKQGGIGPFTKEQNFDKESYSAEVFSENDSASPKKGLGPFTKDQNPKPYDDKPTFKPQNIFANVRVFSGSSENTQRTSNPWAVADLNDGESNSLENPESESGRGFSDGNPMQKLSPTTSLSTSLESTTGFSGEIREPVLKVSKKETGRSMKLPEITEPILRPRPARQNGIFDNFRRDKQLENPETSRGFTVQFLPERLAGILAQAERYARQTLLPLISQYTPSFVGGARNRQPKYFPPLGDIADERLEDTFSREIVNADNERTGGVGDVGSDNSKESYNDNDDATSEKSSILESTATMKSVETSLRSDGNDSEKLRHDSKLSGTGGNDWIPMKGNIAQGGLGNFTGNRENGTRDLKNGKSMGIGLSDEGVPGEDVKKFEGKWMTEDRVWSPKVEDANAGPDTKIDDWIPIVDRRIVSPGTEDLTLKNTSENNEQESTSVGSKDTSTETAGKSYRPVDQNHEGPEKSPGENKDSQDDITEKETPRQEDERKFIPLVDFTSPDAFFVSTTTSGPIKETANSTIESGPVSHIQRIPGPTRAAKPLVSRAMVFPYAYERKNDPRTRYIPLFPEEDIGRPNPLLERNR